MSVAVSKHEAETEPTEGQRLLLRAAAIGLPLAQIAREASLDTHTVGALRNGSARVQLRTIEAVRAVVQNHELTQLDRLSALYPDRHQPATGAA